MTKYIKTGTHCSPRQYTKRDPHSWNHSINRACDANYLLYALTVNHTMHVTLTIPVDKVHKMYLAHLEAYVCYVWVKLTVWKPGTHCSKDIKLLWFCDNNLKIEVSLTSLHVILEFRFQILSIKVVPIVLTLHSWCLTLNLFSHNSLLWMQKVKRVDAISQCVTFLQPLYILQCVPGCWQILNPGGWDVNRQNTEEEERRAITYHAAITICMF